MTDKNNENNDSRPVWKVENTHPELVEGLKDSFREVVDPEIGLNIIELGLIRDVTIKENSALISMILTTPFCPYGPALLEMSRKKAEEFLQIPTHVELGMEMWDFSMMEEGAGGDWGLY